MANALNNIAENQNQPHQIRRLISQRRFYSRAKMIAAAQMSLSIPVAIAWSIVASFAPRLQLWAALWGLCASFLDALLLDALQKRWKLIAAGIQEQFDTEVLALPWNDFKVPCRPDPELSVTEPNEKNKASLIDWYSPYVSMVPLGVARIVCQRSSVWWDAQLRMSYRTWIVVVNVVVFAILFIVAFATQLTLQKFVLAVVAPLSPMFLWSIKEYGRQSESIESADRLKKYFQRLWTKIIARGISAEELTSQSRMIQDEVYDRRKSGPFVFDWIYRLLRPHHEHAMVAGADDLIREYNEVPAQDRR